MTPMTPMTPRTRTALRDRRPGRRRGQARWLAAGLCLVLAGRVGAQDAAPNAAQDTTQDAAPNATQDAAQDAASNAAHDAEADAAAEAFAALRDELPDDVQSALPESEDEPLPPAQDVELQAPSGPVLLGELIEVVARGPGLAGLGVDLGEHLGDVVVTHGSPVAEGDTDVVRLALRLLREGSYRLPLAVQRKDGREQALPALEVEVQLDLPVGRKPRVAQLLDPIAVSQPVAPTWPFLVAALVGLAAIGAWVVALGRHRPVYTYAPPPDQVAIAALARLRLELPRTREEIRPFVIRVSDVLRTYVEGAFAMHAPAQTTEEFLAAAAQRQDALGERRATLGDFLQHCDLVKYAGERPAPAAALPLLDTVEGFVVETRVALAAEPVHLELVRQEPVRHEPSKHEEVRP